MTWFNTKVGSQLGPEWWTLNVDGASDLEIWGPGSHCITAPRRVTIPDGEFWLYTPERPREIDDYHVVSGPFPTLEAAKTALLMLL